MRIFAVDADNDLYLAPNGRMAVNTEMAALVQACEHAMQAVAGEMVFAGGRGLPYWETIWSGAPNLRLFESIARLTLRRIPGVLAVDVFACEIRDNGLSYQATIRSIYGAGTISSTGAANG